MKASVCKQFGPPESLVMEELPSSAPGPGQIRIAVHAAGINPNDLLKLKGEHHERPVPPRVPDALRLISQRDHSGKVAIVAREA